MDWDDVIGLAQTSYGPLGSLQWAGNGECELTNVSDRVWARNDGRHRENAMWKLMMELLRSQTSIHGDCGWFVMLLTGLLVRKCRDLSIGHMMFEKVVTKCLRWTVEAIEEHKIPVQIDDIAVVNRLVSCAMSAKHAAALNAEELEHLVTCVLRGFYRSLNIFQNMEAKNVIHMFEVLGEEVRESQVLLQTVILEVPLPLHVVKFVKENNLQSGGKVIVFDISLKLGKGNEGLHLATISCEKDWNLQETELEMLRTLGKEIGSSGAAFLFSQRVVHPWLRQYLLENHGIITIDQLSAKYIDTVQKLTGAHVFGQIDSKFDSPRLLGDLDHFAIEFENGRQYIRLGNNRSSYKIVTLKICCTDRHMMTEVVVVVNRTLKLLQRFIENPFALHGAGTIEHTIIRYVKRQQEQEQGQTEACGKTATMVLQQYVDTLETIVAHLDPRRTNQMVVQYDIWEALKDRPMAGWDPVESTYFDNQRCKILDSGPAKLNAFKVALNSAIVLYRIQNVIVT